MPSDATSGAERSPGCGRSWRRADIMKVGLRFGNLLIRGIVQYVFARPNGSAEFCCLAREAAEECRHTQMSQGCVNRIGADKSCSPRPSTSCSVISPPDG
ncbi:MAG: diiron oxygenase [Aeromicrobium sp.]|uniref:diiron oxygenase n=1 Tax=Aeromicrobium sp. TaxID=1871063 RepID=UPI0039E25D7B